MDFTVRARIGAVYRVTVQLTESLEVLDHLVRPCDLHRRRQRLVVDPFVVEKTRNDSMGHMVRSAAAGTIPRDTAGRSIAGRSEPSRPAIRLKGV
ncbi:hypothetical protein AB0H92_32060 [Streptomyces phaeochromogenes]|uniref:hypothetical protein n=1 Tax=Streptomyces phaeochromogenes TaxID=1923 RepID=UPI0033D91B9C